MLESNAKSSSPSTHFSQTARAAASKVSSGVNFRAQPHPVLPTQRKAPAWPPGTPTWPQHPGGPSSWPPKPETKPPGLNPTPRPVPSWFHPPMALPPPPKEELKEPAWTGAAGGSTKEELEEGVTPPLMSPLAAAAAGAGEGGGGQGLQGLDPRHLLHLLTRKVGNYSPPSSATPTTILIKLSLLHNSVFREFFKTSQPALLACKPFKSFLTFVAPPSSMSPNTLVVISVLFPFWI